MRWATGARSPLEVSGSHYFTPKEAFVQPATPARVVIMSDLDRYYKVLGLEPGASLDEVNQAYRDLAFIWHPDRIPKDNPRLQQKAQEKLKEINQARDRLRSVRPGEKNRNPEPPPRDRAHPPSSYYQSSYSYQSPPQSPPQSHHQAPKQQSDLSGANLSGANLKEKDLSGRNLSNANLSNANLSDAFLHKVNLQGANLEKANLFRANLLQAKLNNANLREANLIGADLSGADLRGADLRGAKVGSQDRVLVKLTGANLAGAILPDGSIHG